ncbi:hypothetical protein PtA15_17A153 [Puccinia triticina]|uniref:GRIP domain-containing protein n=1 Tax=Puccinia triticina TaxID=208348 RepID=A0ABY7D5M0_9BASI|nr:uncharacterized protein PtA15_17A153 [Puccinia triticina]WAQ92671.1 hypothetical protein PtA15_17A153 [Puccinia triticina]
MLPSPTHQQHPASAPSCSPSPHASHIPPITPPLPQSSTLVDPASSFVSLDNPALDDEAQFNFEYLRNTLLQFLEHKEMRGRPLPLSLHRCRLLERGPYFFFSTAVAIAAPLVKVLGVILHFTPQEIQLNATRNTN